MKKGFTLVEVLGVIIIIGIIGLIVFPIINSTINNNKENLYQSQLKMIEEETNKWMFENTLLLPSKGDEITIYVYQLKKDGYLSINLKDPRDNKLIPNDMEIVIKNISLEGDLNDNYKIEIKKDTGTDFNVSKTNELNMTLNGSSNISLSLNANYQELGASAFKGSEEVEVNIMILKDDDEVENIDTTKEGTYTVIYYAIDNTTSFLKRTVRVE